MRKTIPLKLLCLGCLALMLSACGGGGGGDSSSSTASSTSAATSSSSSSSLASNAVTLTIDGYQSSVNQLYTTVTVCAPGSTSNCATVDHVLVDTGSTGLRLMASKLSTTLVSALTQQTYGGVPLVECMQFGSGYTWGSVRTADLYLGSETAGSLPIQVIGDSSYATVPSDCSNTGSSIGSVSSLGANGILGVSQSLQDCGKNCVSSGSANIYFVCSSSSACTATALPLANQILHPVSKFSTDNNGVVLVLPAVSSTGASSVTGTMYFGVGTQSNNATGSATIYGTDSYGDFAQTTYSGTSFTYGFLDSGSNGYFFPSTIASCGSGSSASGWYCPASTTAVSVAITGVSGVVASQSATLSLSIANAGTLFATGHTAYSNLGAYSSGMFDIGLPFFYGRSVYVAIDGMSTPSGTGPYVAF